MTGLANELLQAATRHFQVYKGLNASCPRCNSQIVLKYASNPQGRTHHGRKLSVIICCGDDCDRAIWGSDAEEKQFTHWWIDGKERNLEGLKSIMDSLTREEAEFLLELCEEVTILNLRYRDSHANVDQP